MTAEERISQIGVEIRRYLAAHPQAADSATGIGQWWLAGLEFEATPMDVQRALEAMVERGELSVATLADGARLYSVCTEKH
jgi:hypothetical protein